MTTTTTLPLLPALHREIDELDVIELTAVQRMIARMRMARSLDKLNDLADAKKPAVSDAEMAAVIAEVRRQRRAQS